MNELHRTLTKDGILAIGSATKAFMETLPFVKYGFQLYAKSDIENLISNSLFSDYSIETHREEVTSKTGEKVEREFFVTSLRK